MDALLVSPRGPDSFFGLRHLMRVTGASAAYPPLGLLTVAALLPADWRLRLVDLHAEPLTDETIRSADLVFVSAMLAQEPSARDVIARCHLLGRRVVCGGPLFTNEPERFPDADHLVLDEAEVTLPPFLRDLAAGTAARIYRAEGRPDLSATPPPRWDLIDPRRYVSMALQVSRGCPFDCEFCNVITLFGRHWRSKPTARVLNELDALHETGWRGLVLIVDDNFIGRPAATRDILSGIARWQQARRYPFILSTQATLQLAEDEEIMRLMTDAGFNVVEIGIESTEPASLVEAGKRHNLGVNPAEAVRSLHRHGLAVVGTFIAGFDHDPPDVFDRQVAFIERVGIPMAKLWLLQAFPGSRLHQRVTREGRLGREPITEGTMNFAPRLEMPALERGYRQALRQLYAPEAFEARMRRFLADYRPRSASRLTWREAGIFARSVFLQGLLDGWPRARGYWRLIGHTLRRNPAAWKDAFVPIIFSYHARRWLDARWPGGARPIGSKRVELQRSC